MTSSLADGGALRGYPRDTLLSNGRYRIERELNSEPLPQPALPGRGRALPACPHTHTQTHIPVPTTPKRTAPRCPGGATAVVYAAEDLQLRCYVALKVGGACSSLSRLDLREAAPTAPSRPPPPPPCR
jgi:hypothetical protein